MEQFRKFASALALMGTFCFPPAAESGQGGCLDGAKCVPFERDGATEFFVDCSSGAATICLGEDEELAPTDGGTDFVTSMCSAGIIFDDSFESYTRESFGLMASISFDDDNGIQGEPKELIAERPTIKGCRGRALR